MHRVSDVCNIQEYITYVYCNGRRKCANRRIASFNVYLRPCLQEPKLSLLTQCSMLVVRITLVYQGVVGTND